VSEAVMGMMRFYQEQQLREGGIAAPPVHDPCAVARVARPELVACADAQVEVELAGRLTTGMTVTDFRPRDARFNAKVGTSLDVDGFWDLFIDALARVPDLAWSRTYVRE
jgi:inosine-uridine nucleoside N-ribohydrolase